MSEKSASRGKSRRFSTGTPTGSNDSELQVSWSEAILSHGGAGCGSQGAGRDTDLSASELFELHRRCFSCCNMLFQQHASVEDDESMMLMQQPKLMQHPVLKAIMERVSKQGYTDIMAFVDDLTSLIHACVGQQDHQALLDTLNKHVDRTGQADPRRSVKATFQGYSHPHPIVDDMMAQSALARKKLLPGGLTHVSVDVGRFFAKAYGMGLSRGARFCGKASEEKTFLEKRKKKEAEAAARVNGVNGVGVKVPAAGWKAQKKNSRRLSGNHGGASKKKSKVQPVCPATTKPARSLRTTRRQSSAEDGALRNRPLFDSDVPVVNQHVNQHVPISFTRSGGVQQRVKLRSRVHCYHLQGQVIEMDDAEFGGKGFLGQLTGTAVACNCGCEATMTGAHWLIHNGGRTSNKQTGYPYRFMRVFQTKENLFTHYEDCDSHKYLCDTCNSWDTPGAPMTTCYVCYTSVHATEECAVRSILSKTEAFPAGTSTAPGPTGDVPATAAADSRGEAYHEGAGSKAAKAPKAANGSAVEHGVEKEDSNKSAVSLAWRPPTPALMPPTAAGAVARSRPCRQKSAGQRFPRDGAGKSAPNEGGSLDGSSSKALTIKGGKANGGGVREAAAREGVIVWKCIICARPEMDYP